MKEMSLLKLKGQIMGGESLKKILVGILRGTKEEKTAGFLGSDVLVEVRGICMIDSFDCFFRR